MGFAKGKGGHSDDLAQQQKKKIIYHTAFSFPHVRKRLEVTSKSEIILSPIENAIELIQGTVISLRQILESTPPNRNKLHHILSGTILAGKSCECWATCFM